ncbi:hypothetical protein HPB47_006614 [Ixodes persulcatus]|uniref:Uncharacterized protein n=1 Tax=Ixodes persulcatus TaxID=34615 RepID=A0AC60P9M5_IXOPE|nr:hypothetical protein HPB47_006614 [Ixodes persulcatus]
MVHQKGVERQYPNLTVTYEFVALMVELIKVMTSRFPARALRLGKTQEGMLDKVLAYLDDWERHADGKGFLSRSTSEGLRVTLQSTKELLAYLTHKVGHRYLMTSRLSQDCIERFFGIGRQSSAVLRAAATKEGNMGGLLYPSEQLFKLILTLENELAQVFSACQLHAGLMVDILPKQPSGGASSESGRVVCLAPEWHHCGTLLRKRSILPGLRREVAIASIAKAVRRERERALPWLDTSHCPNDRRGIDCYEPKSSADAVLVSNP